MDDEYANYHARFDELTRLASDRFEGLRLYKYITMERIVDETIDMTEKVHVPIEKKMNLTIKEAAEYSNIGINKIAELLRNPMCSFVLYIGNKKLV